MFALFSVAHETKKKEKKKRKRKRKKRKAKETTKKALNDTVIMSTNVSNIHLNKAAEKFKFTKESLRISGII